MSVSAPKTAGLPKNLLFATSARIGGIGLDLCAQEQLRLPLAGSYLGCAVAFQNRCADIPNHKVRSLRWDSVRLLSFLDRPYYYGAKRHAVGRVAAAELCTGKYDFFHGWAGDSLEALREAHARGIPSVLDIPTWHVDHGFRRHETIPPPGGIAGKLFPRAWLDRLPVRPERLREEYRLATVVLTRSTYATETFLEAGFAPERVCHTDEGADIERFQPGEAPQIFRALFVGALIRRKGVDVLLEAWHRLALPNAELVLVGHVHEEIVPALEKFAGDSVRVIGKSSRVEDYFRSATVHIFPSLCEGCAKVTCEAAACGLPQITTRESGDVVIDGMNGLHVPPGDVGALCAAIERLQQHPELLATMRTAARARALNHFTWQKYRARLELAYRRAWSLRGKS